MRHPLSGRRYGGISPAALSVLCAIAFVCFAPALAHAQVNAHGILSPRPQHAQLSMPAWSNKSQMDGDMPPFIGFEKVPSGRRHVLFGAAMGGAAGALFALSQLQGESMVSPVIAVGGPVLVGASAGAFLGYLVYLAKR